MLSGPGVSLCCWVRARSARSLRRDRLCRWRRALLTAIRYSQVEKLLCMRNPAERAKRLDQGLLVDILGVFWTSHHVASHVQDTRVEAGYQAFEGPLIPSLRLEDKGALVRVHEMARKKAKRVPVRGVWPTPRSSLAVDDCVGKRQFFDLRLECEPAMRPFAQLETGRTYPVGKGVERKITGSLAVGGVY